MKLAILQVESFQGAPDGVYEFARPGDGNAPALLTGPRGIGRTSLLRAIVAARETISPAGPPWGASRLLRRERSSGALEATWLLEPDEVDLARLNDAAVTTRLEFGERGVASNAPAGLRKLMGRFSREARDAKMELLPEEIVTLGSNHLPDDAALKRQRTEERADKYAWAPAVLGRVLVGDAVAVRERLRTSGLVIEGDVDGEDRAKPYREAARRLAPHVQIGPARDRGAGPEATFGVGGVMGLAWDELATSDRRALTLAIAMQHLGLGRSILAWDGPDRWFDGDARARMVAGLRALAPDAQLIMAAADPTGLDMGAGVRSLS